MYMKFTKARDVKTPSRANHGDAGIDFFFPEEFEASAYPFLTIGPHSRVNVPSGIKVEVPFGYALVFFNKSGVAAKHGLIVGACVVDHGYRGEVHLNMINTNDYEVRIGAGTKAVQALLVPVVLPSLIEVSEGGLYSDVMVAGARGSGGFGSTDGPVDEGRHGVSAGCTG